MLASFLLSASDSDWARVSVAVTNGLLVVVAFRLTSLRVPTWLVAALVTLGFSAALVTWAVDFESRWQAVAAFAEAALMAALSIVLMSAVVRRTVVDGQTVVGAVTCYLLLGLLFGWLYLGLDTVDDDQISLAASDVTAFPEFSFVVLTTLGFGDVVPTAALSGRVVALEAITGQVFLATFLARLVSLYGQRRMDAAES